MRMKWNTFSGGTGEHWNRYSYSTPPLTEGATGTRFFIEPISRNGHKAGYQLKSWRLTPSASWASHGSYRSPQQAKNAANEQWKHAADKWILENPSRRSRAFKKQRRLLDAFDRGLKASKLPTLTRGEKSLFFRNVRMALDEAGRRGVRVNPVHYAKFSPRQFVICAWRKYPFSKSQKSLYVYRLHGNTLSVTGRKAMAMKFRSRLVAERIMRQLNRAAFRAGIKAMRVERV